MAMDNENNNTENAEQIAERAVKAIKDEELEKVSGGAVTIQAPTAEYKFGKK